MSHLRLSSQPKRVEINDFVLTDKNSSSKGVVVGALHPWHLNPQSMKFLFVA